MNSIISRVYKFNSVNNFNYIFHLIGYCELWKGTKASIKQHPKSPKTITSTTITYRIEIKLPLEHTRIKKSNRLHKNTRLTINWKQNAEWNTLEHAFCEHTLKY